MTRLSPRNAALRTRESLLAILAENAAPVTGRQLQAAHGRLDQYIYTQLMALQRAGEVCRIRPVISLGTCVYWCLPEYARGTCSIGECIEITSQFVGPLLQVDDIWGRSRLLWREIHEMPGTGGWACGVLGTGCRTHLGELMHARRHQSLERPVSTPNRGLMHTGAHSTEGNCQ